MLRNRKHRALFEIDPTVTLSGCFVQPPRHALGLIGKKVRACRLDRLSNVISS